MFSKEKKTNKTKYQNETTRISFIRFSKEIKKNLLLYMNAYNVRMCTLCFQQDKCDITINV